MRALAVRVDVQQRSIELTIDTYNFILLPLYEAFAFQQFGIQISAKNAGDDKSCAARLKKFLALFSPDEEFNPPDYCGILLCIFIAR